jgi:uncharacterized protein (DUF486 family)
MLRATILLVLSNVFMTFAWYGHLRFVNRALWAVVLVSWGIAFFEYCLQVPANRFGFMAGMTGAELKTLQEVITLGVFVFFASWYLKEPIRWNHIAGFVMIGLGATLVFAPWIKRAESSAGSLSASPVRAESPFDPPEALASGDGGGK